MDKFKIGDLVRIKPDSRSLYAGEFGKIVDIDGSALPYRVLNDVIARRYSNGYWVHAHSVEKVEDAPVATFKVGDRVRCPNHVGQGVKYLESTDGIGVIVNTRVEDGKVNYRVDWGDNYWYHWDTEIVKVEETQVNTFKPGDKVTVQGIVRDTDNSDYACRVDITGGMGYIWVRADALSFAAPKSAAPLLSDSVLAQVKDLARAGNKIAAIKLVRQHTSMGLKEAKDFVEGLDLSPPSITQSDEPEIITTMRIDPHTSRDQDREFFKALMANEPFRAALDAELDKHNEDDAYDGYICRVLSDVLRNVALVSCEIRILLDMYDRANKRIDPAKVARLAALRAEVAELEAEIES